MQYVQLPLQWYLNLSPVHGLGGVQLARQHVVFDARATLGIRAIPIPVASTFPACRMKLLRVVPLSSDIRILSPPGRSPWNSGLNADACCEPIFSLHFTDLAQLAS